MSGNYVYLATSDDGLRVCAIATVVCVPYLPGSFAIITGTIKAGSYVGDGSGLTNVDAEGVALAAIQGLNEKLEVRGQNSENGSRDHGVESAAGETGETLESQTQRVCEM